MENEPFINERHELIIKQICQFWPSAKFHSAKYLKDIFVDHENPPEHRIYICPLCIKNFILIERSVGFAWTTEFDFDHFPPESVGGFYKLLVCKSCNSDAGSSYDYSLKEKLERIGFEKKIIAAAVPVKSQITKVPGNYSSTFFINENGEMEIDLKPNQKAHAPFLDKWLDESKMQSDWEMKITIRNPDDAKVSKALVKAAYLYCFGNWGYDFVYSYTGDMIRRYLKDECEYPVQVPFAWLGTGNSDSQLPGLPLGLCYIQKPASCRAFMVNLQLQDKETGHREIASVLIPSPIQDGGDELKRIRSIVETNYGGTAEFEIAHVTDFILSNNEYQGYFKSWEKLQSME